MVKPRFISRVSEMSIEHPHTQQEHEPYKKDTDAFVNSCTPPEMIST